MFDITSKEVSELKNKVEELLQVIASLESNEKPAPAPIPQTATPTNLKVFAKVKAIDLSTGKELAMKNKLGKTEMSPPAAYGMVKRCKKHPILSRGFDYRVELIKRPE